MKIEWITKSNLTGISKHNMVSIVLGESHPEANAELIQFGNMLVVVDCAFMVESKFGCWASILEKLWDLSIKYAMIPGNILMKWKC